MKKYCRERLSSSHELCRERVKKEECLELITLIMRERGKNRFNTHRFTHSLMKLCCTAANTRSHLVKQRQQQRCVYMFDYRFYTWNDQLFQTLHQKLKCWDILGEQVGLFMDCLGNKLPKSFFIGMVKINENSLIIYPHATPDVYNFLF